MCRNQCTRKEFLIFKIVAFGINNFSKKKRNKIYRASHIRFISEFILYATKNTDDADSLIPFIM
jgi:hypothetical protein